MNRHFNINHVYRSIDDAGAGGGEPADEPIIEPAALEEEPAAPVAADPAEIARQVEEQVNARMLAFEAEQARRTQVQPDPSAAQAAAAAAAYRERLEEIAYETDPVKAEEMRMELAEQRVQARLAPELSHSRAQGAMSAVMRTAEFVDDAAKPFIEEVVQQFNINPAALGRVEAQNVADIAYARAVRAGKITQSPAPTPAERTPVSGAAPTASAPKARTFEGGLARDEQEHLARYIAEYTPPGVDASKAWDEKKKATIVREYREAKEYRASLQ